MKTRNQFLRRIVRLCVSTFAVALLGIGCGSAMKNNSLLIKVDRAFVSSEICASITQVVIPVATLQLPATAVFKTDAYTCMNAKVFVPRDETRMNMCYFEGKRLGQIELSINRKMPTVIKSPIRKPPRGDMIELNTS